MNLDRAQLDQLYRYALALTGHRAEAEDLLHTCLSEYLGRSRSDVLAPVAWLRQMVRSRFHDGLRRRRVVQFEPLDDALTVADPQPALESSVVDAATLARVWEELAPPEREVMYLWAVDGLSASEIALQLGQPRGSILSRMHRARQKLQARFPSLVEGEEHG